MLPPGVAVSHERLDNGDLGGEPADDLQSQERMFQVVQHPEEEHDVELAQPRRGELENVEDPVINAGGELAAHLQEARKLDAIYRRYLRAAALRLETEPAVPSPDVEDALAIETIRDRKPRVALLQLLQADEAVEPRAVRQLEAVVAALLRQLADEALAPADLPDGARVRDIRRLDGIAWAGHGKLF